jgi:N-acetylglucosaminyldiphosphoundecaprenol N-acetyl-beta-D-mannosaminyltransferase
MTIRHGGGNPTEASNVRPGVGNDRISLLGVAFDRVTERQAVHRIAEAVDAGEGGWVITPNVDILRQAVGHPDCAALLEQATLVLADGTPLVWASRLQGDPLPERVAGSDLVWSVTEMAAGRNAPVFLLGGEPGVADRAAGVLVRRFPGLVVAGTSCPPHGFDRDPALVAEVIETVRRAAPRIVIVALGFPKQEHLIQELRAVLPDAWMLGLGISLSFVAGDVARAPRALQVSGLEWFHRFAQEPRRLARRYLLHGLPFALYLLLRAAMTRMSRQGAI